MSRPEPFVASPTEGESFTAGPFFIVSRVQGGQSNGLFELYDLKLDPSTIDYHVHNTMDETLTVLEGEGNAAQRLSLQGAPSGGQIVFTFNGQKSPPITYSTGLLMTE